MLRSTRNKIRYLIVFIVLVVVVTLLIGITKNVSLRSKAMDYKVIDALTLDSALITIQLNQPDTTLILIFNSECDICRIEIKKMLNEYQLLATYRICLLSKQCISDLKHVQRDLENYPSIELFKIDEVNTKEPFNKAPTPSMFIYDTAGKLIFQRKGYTNPCELNNLIENDKKN